MSESFGARLRARREAGGLALAAIADDLKIKPSLLEAVERDDVSHWPSGIYRRAFIRAYAQAIGLSPDDVVREFLELFPDPDDLFGASSLSTAAADAAWTGAGPPTRLRHIMDSAIGSLSKLRRGPVQESGVSGPAPAAAPFRSEPVAYAGPTTPVRPCPPLPTADPRRDYSAGVQSDRTAAAPADQRVDVPAVPQADVPLVRKDEAQVIRKDEVPVIRKDEVPVIRKDEVPVIRKDEVLVIRKDDVAGLPRADVSAMPTAGDAAEASTPVARPAAAPAASAAAPVPPAAAQPAAAPAPQPGPDFLAVADLCTGFGCVRTADDLPPLLAEAARILDAIGLIVWLWDTDAEELRPALVHGYSEKVLAHLPAVSRDADNATAAAFRSARPCALRGNARNSGALVVPLMQPDGCAGVLAIEVPDGLEQSAPVHAAAMIVAAALAPLVARSAPIAASS